MPLVLVLGANGFIGSHVAAALGAQPDVEIVGAGLGTPLPGLERRWLDLDLLAGDAAEWPLPTLAQRGGYADYMQTLRMLKGLGAHTVLPSHGPPMDASLVEANERYIGELFAAVAELKQKGAARDELALPVERFVGADLIVSDVYRRVHSENLAWAYDEV